MPVIPTITLGPATKSLLLASSNLQLVLRARLAERRHHEMVKWGASSSGGVSLAGLSNLSQGLTTFYKVFGNTTGLLTIKPYANDKRCSPALPPSKLAITSTHPN